MTSLFSDFFNPAKLVIDSPAYGSATPPMGAFGLAYISAFFFSFSSSCFILTILDLASLHYVLNFRIFSKNLSLGILLGVSAK
jgi:hypothetical protein